MNNTINVPRELLERVIMSTHMYWPDAPLIKEIRALLSAPSPVGVDGLKPAAMIRRKSPLGTEYACEAISYNLPNGTGLCRLSDAQAIIDGLRGEVARYKTMSDNYCAIGMDANQRIGELEGLLRESGKTIHKLQAEQPTPARIARYLDAIRAKIDAALSA